MIKKILIFGFCLLFYSLNLLAGDGKYYISLKGAASVPMGKYHSNNLSDGCFTTTGFSVGAQGTWFFHKNLGAIIDFNFSLHPVDAPSLATETLLDDQFMLDLTIRTDPYNIKTYMLGIVYRIPIYEKLSVHPKILVGLMYGHTPFQLYDATYVLLGPHSFRVTESRDHNFAFKGGVDLVYDFNDYVGVGLSIDYIYSKLFFGFETATGPEVKERNISYLDTGLKLLLRLW
jgi:hypothetical protein